MTIDLIRPDDRFANAPCKRGSIGGLLHLSHDYCELITSQARDRIRLSRAAAQPISNNFQKLIADRMAKRIIHALEMIKIEAQHRQTLTPFDAFELVFQPLAQQHSIREIG